MTDETSGPGVRVQTTARDAWRASVRVEGDLDVATAGDVRDTLLGHLRADRRVLRVDASGVTFADATALGALVTVHEQCRHQAGTLILTGVRPPLRKLLTLTGLDQVLLVDAA